MKIKTSDDKIKSFLSGTDIPHQRQLLPELFYPNGAIYIANTNWFLNTGTMNAPELDYYFMPPHLSIDVDSDLDFKMAEMIMSEIRNQSMKS